MLTLYQGFLLLVSFGVVRIWSELTLSQKALCLCNISVQVKRDFLLLYVCIVFHFNRMTNGVYPCIGCSILSFTISLKEPGWEAFNVNIIYRTTNFPGFYFTFNCAVDSDSAWTQEGGGAVGVMDLNKVESVTILPYSLANQNECYINSDFTKAYIQK